MAAGTSGSGVGIESSRYSSSSSDAVLRLTAGTRQAPEPGKQCCEMRRVLLDHCCEFESQAVTRLNVPHDRLGPDLSFLDGKIEPGFRVHRPWTWGSNQQNARAQVPGRVKLHPYHYNGNRPRHRPASRRETYAAASRKVFAEKATQSTLSLA